MVELSSLSAMVAPGPKARRTTSAKRRAISGAGKVQIAWSPATTRTEAPFLQQLCPTLVLGPGSIDQAHQPDEFLAFEFIDPTIDILKRSIQKYCF